MAPTQPQGIAYDFTPPTYTPPIIGCDVVQEARLVDEFRFAINDLYDVVSQLQIRTLPVSRPDYAIPETDAFDRSAVSDARTELYRLHALVADVRGIIDRLEV